MTLTDEQQTGLSKIVNLYNFVCELQFVLFVVICAVISHSKDSVLFCGVKQTHVPFSDPTSVQFRQTVVWTLHNQNYCTVSVKKYNIHWRVPLSGGVMANSSPYGKTVTADFSSFMEKMVMKYYAINKQLLSVTFSVSHIVGFQLDH